MTSVQEGVGASVSTDLTALQSRISALTEAQPFAVHWQIRTLTAPQGHTGDAQAVEGGVIGAGADTQLAAFSTRKVSLLLACLTLVHRGDLHLGQRLTVTEEMKDGVQAGIMKNMAPGVELSLEDHLRQMMITSDNICTQLVFEAIGQVTGDALQWVNDYCSWVGMRATVHREIFPRSADLSWHHSIDHMTVTTPADQARLLALLGSGTHDDDAADYAAADSAAADAAADAAARLHLTPELCRFAVEPMRRIYTPLLGGRTAELQFAEKNGRGLRSLSQVGLASTSDGGPVAAVAVYAENIPTQLPDGTPGRLAAYDLFSAIGQAVEDWHLESDSEPDLDQVSQKLPAAWATSTLTTGETTHQGSSEPTTAHPLAGTGKLFAAVALAERAEREPNLLQTPVTISGAHRSHAGVGPLRTHTGNLTLALGDALGLIIGTCDAATSLAVREALEARNVDLVAETQGLLTQLGEAGADSTDTASTDTALRQTSITGVEEPAHIHGDLVVGETTPEDLVRLLSLLASAGGLHGGLAGDVAADRHGHLHSGPTPGESHRGISAAAATRVLSWMSQVFEPAGLTYALPGYGPKKVPQWSVSGLELRSPSSSPSSVSGSQGWTSVMIARNPGKATGTDRLVLAAAHVPPPAEPTALAGRQVSQSLGALGSAAYWGSGLP